MIDDDDVSEEAERPVDDHDIEGFRDVVDFLEAAGEALYGSRWQTSISRDLEVSDRTVRNWSARKFDIPPGVMFDLVALIQSRRSELEKVERRAEEMVKRMLTTRGDNS